MDYIISKYTGNRAPSGFEEVKRSIVLPKKDLTKDQETLAEIKKFNLGLQNIRVSPDLQEYIKKTLIDKNK